MADSSAAVPLLRLVRDIVRLSAAGFSGVSRKDCTDLALRISLLAHLLEEIMDSDRSRRPRGDCSAYSSSSRISCFSDLSVALQAAKRLIFAADNFQGSADRATKKIFFQFQCVTWKLEKALNNVPFDDFEISEEVIEQGTVETSHRYCPGHSHSYSKPYELTLNIDIGNELSTQKLNGIDDQL